MSKRNSLGNTSGTNTLFKYFTKSPAASPKTPQQSRGTASASNSDATPKSSLKKDDLNDTKNRSSNKKAQNECNDDDSPIQRFKPKRLKLIDSDSDSDRENENDNSKSIDRVPKKKNARPATNEPSNPHPKKKIKIDLEGKTSKSFEEKLKEMVVQDVHDVEDTLEEMDDEPVLWLHKKLEFLKPKKIKDINGHKADHPDYDPKTLFVPKDYLDGLTPVSYLV